MNASSKVISIIVIKFVTLFAEWHAVKQQHPYPEIAWAQNVWIDLSVVLKFFGFDSFFIQSTKNSNDAYKRAGMFELLSKKYVA